MPRNGEQFTQTGWLVCAWVLVTPFNYGYHISLLNQIQTVLTCKDVSPNIPTAGCIPMSDFVFSSVTAIFTAGGLVGSLVANYFMERSGRKGASRMSAIFVAVGSALMGISTSVGTLAFGRLLVGIGAGIGICVSPLYLAEIAPSKISGNVGVLTQLGIVLGIMITQAIGLRFATPSEWRYVLFLSSGIAIAQLFLSPAIVESPAWLGSKGHVELKKAAVIKLWGSAAPTTPSLEDPLLDNLEAHRNEQITALTVPQALSAEDIRRPLATVCFAMLSQQLSGINAVLYYSNDILSKSLPNLGPYVSLGITVVNVVMTFPPILLIDRIGRRQLLYISSIGAISSLVLVGFGLNLGFGTLSSIAILSFVTSFACGLGPIPFVLIPEISPFHAVSALSSIALSLNWSANFLVGLVFLPLRNALAGHGEGTVFFVFAVALLCSMGLGFRTADKGLRRRGP
ncbi:25S rRNA adenine-N(1) methyltransferase [Mycena indigotica]|uniref:25S rRNA adenine-N(1) methyltransferase n=1 Tax=Mycena indigotica TaxID=2126181 RepID=A0A8H6SCC7_9AGAR|nr:25S rRNA adenine-N(1) methyltransferase [Mycena indigotica]KAF7295255.1 25S rRNA adenine-N(1) methyltransferase [Mycena indigotica]